MRHLCMNPLPRPQHNMQLSVAVDLWWSALEPAGV
jgi:hypothetical protein